MLQRPRCPQGQLEDSAKGTHCSPRVPGDDVSWICTPFPKGSVIEDGRNKDLKRGSRMERMKSRVPCSPLQSRVVVSRVQVLVVLLVLCNKFLGVASTKFKCPQYFPVEII